MKVFFNHIKKILNAKWVILKPKKKKFLIYDGKTDLLYKIVNKSECEILYNRFEKINFYILFLTFIRSGLKNLNIQYKINFIKSVSPKFVLTSIDNDISFYKLKNFYSDTCYVSIQNGMRSPHIYYELFEKKSNLISPPDIDYLFVFGESVKKKILENFKFNIIVSGSILNNHYVFNQDKNEENNSILFVSQFSNKQYKKLKRFPESERAVFNTLYKFCEKKKLDLSILPKDVSEEYYRKNLVSGNWKYINKNNNSSYLFLNNFKMIIFLYSTLGYEALSRGLKCACFPYGCLDNEWKKKNQLLSTMIPFGYPGNYENVGPFWSNMRSTQIMEETLEKVFNYTKKEWEEISAKFIPNIMQYDPGNSIISKIINKNSRNISHKTS